MVLARLMAVLSMAIGWFVVCFAQLGAVWSGAVSPALAVVTSAGVAGIWAAMTSRGRSGGSAIGRSLLLTFAPGAPLEFAWVKAGVHPGSPHLEAGFFWVMVIAVSALFCMPLALAMRADRAPPSHDRLDDALVASAAWLTAALASAALSIAVARAALHPIAEAVAVMLGPLLVVTTVLAGLCALAAVVRSARWLARWRAVMRGAPWQVVDASGWSETVPDAAWLRVPGRALDGVLLRVRAIAQGAYRDGGATVAVSRVPRDVAAVWRWLVARCVAAMVIAGVLAALVLGPVSSLRW